MDALGVVYHLNTHAVGNKSNEYKIHLRSIKDEEDKVRCDEIADKLGGGGHRGAASFFMNRNYFLKNFKVD